MENEIFIWPTSPKFSFSDQFPTVFIHENASNSEIAADELYQFIKLRSFKDPLGFFIFRKSSHIKYQVSAVDKK